VTFLQSEIDVLGTSTRKIQSQIDVLGTTTVFLQSEIDSITAFAHSCCDATSSSVTFLQSEIDVLGTSTRKIQSQIDVLGTTTVFLQSEIDSITEFSQSCCATLNSKFDNLESIFEAISVSLPDGIVSRVELLESLVDTNIVDISVLDAFSHSCCATLNSKFDNLESIFEAISVSLPDGIVSRVELLESLVDINIVDISLLDAFSQSCCEFASTSIQFLQSEIDVLGTATVFLQSEIDVIDGFAASCCDSTSSNVAFLQSEIDVLGTSTAKLQSIIDELSTSTGDLQVQISILDAFEQSCCEALNSLIDILESEVDILITNPCIPILAQRVDQLEQLILNTRAVVMKLPVINPLDGLGRRSVSIDEEEV
jgi:hypothetical protein